MLGYARFDLFDFTQASLAAPTQPTTYDLLPPLLGEELLPGGEAVGLEEEAEDEGAVGRHRLVLIAGRPPHELTRPAYALVILDRALEHERLLQRGVLLQRHDGSRLELAENLGWRLEI